MAYLELVKKSNLLANGEEQTLVEIIELTHLEGNISLGQMQVKDTIVLRQYAKVGSGYEKYAEETYSSVQNKPIVYFTPKSNDGGIKLTLQQTAGTYRQFPHCFFKEVKEVFAELSI